ncbi:NAD-dependent epimerase/dehydratase family protein [Gordonia alkaliphila]|uniref:NAD-dependent epimerase/dehydratase family protein n=1 Tax=Gordonia alkaliphila TaxID=1053547 RepID=UPI001FF1C225|nr:NAD-dependent epimerase/dehydratase family protein [Gordonia alkaliphila]MCK0438154.1 NAD-dependent epimerase/dehydratase family protein [Gordonia alkaliphila]
MKVAVTGATGFVGTNLVNILASEGHDVVAIDKSPNPRTDVRPNVTTVVGDILDPAAMRAALADVEVVYHLVAVITLAHRNEMAWRINTEGVRVVAQAALDAGVRRMVHCSSIHSYNQYSLVGDMNEQSVRSVDPALPVYDRSKYQGEVELRAVVDQGLDAVICNPTAVIGPIDPVPMSRVNGILRDAARGRVPAFIRGGFDFVDVRDVAAGLVLAGEKGRTGENYLLGGHYHQLSDLVRATARRCGRRGPMVTFPSSALSAVMPVVEPISNALGSDVLTRASLAALTESPTEDRRKAVTELGHNPRPTDETIGDFAAQLVSSGLLSRGAATHSQLVSA